jgi:hypothetical protein
MFIYEFFKVKIMGNQLCGVVFVNVSNDLYREAKLRGGRNSRSADEQINFWARLGKACIDNPELPTTFVADCLESLSEAQSNGFIPFIPRSTD